MNKQGCISPRSWLSSAQRQQEHHRWHTNLMKGSFGRVHCEEGEGNVDVRKNCLTTEDDRKGLYQMYSRKYRKSAVKTNPSAQHLKSALKSRNSGDENVNVFNPNEHVGEIGKRFQGSKCGDCYARQLFDEKPERDYVEERKTKFVLKKGLKENSVAYRKQNDDDDDRYKVMKEIRTKKCFLGEFRRVYRQVESTKLPKPSVRTDMLAWKEMEKNYGKFLYPVQTVGEVPGVEIGDEFDLRLELIIMGIHFQMIHGIDTMTMYPLGTLLATSVVATEGYYDKMVDPNVLMYVGEGGNFEVDSNKGKGVKDQVMKKGNLGLKNSMMAQNEVRVVRGMKRGWSSKTVFVYDGLYKVEDCFKRYGVCGSKQFVFKLVRCPNQKNIVWAKYK
ncbi:hypothetical protein RND81_09G188000 [Saponaria officinalis]